MSRLDQLTKNLVDVYANKLDEQQRRELMESLEVLAHDAKYNQFKNTFPGEGQFSFDKYVKHASFFAAGSTFRERAFIAGNRCITPWTFIETPNGHRRALEVFASEGADVLSWGVDSEYIAQAFGGFLKCIEPAYRVVLSDGSFFDCTKKHRVLSESGWMSLDRLMSLSSGLRYWQKDVDYQASCVEDGYLCGQPPLVVPGNVPAQPQEVAYARKQLLSFSREDAEARILRYSHVYQQSSLLSTEDENSRFLGLFSEFQAASVPLSVLQLRQNSLSVLLSELGSHQKQSLQKALQNQTDIDALCALLHVLPGGEDIQKQLFQKEMFWWQSPYGTIPVDSSEELLRDGQYIAIFCPFEHPPLVGDKRIISIVPLGFQPIIDATVEGVKNYKAGGVYHHNTGKSVAGAFETVCHATGIYPEWWTGKVYHKPLMIWVGGDTAVTCRDIIQFKLLGDIGDFGSGMIPKDLIVETKTRRNVPDAIETIRVRHVSGGITTIVIKTYEQGRAAWQGTEVNFIWIDEECPQDVYGEALIRLMTTKGSIILTFTPLSGLTPLVVDFLDHNQDSNEDYKRYVESCTWYDVPHLDSKDIQELLAATPENLRDARSRGIPTVGDGNIYPLPLEMVTVDDFKIPKYFPKAYGMDVGWNNTAAVFGAWDRDSDIIYIYSEHKQGKADPSAHAAAIRGRGTWLRGSIDPAARASGQADGTQLLAKYTLSLERGGGGLKVYPAINAVEAGIFAVWERFQSGRLKIFKSCTQIQREFSLYHRKDGKIVKSNDHLLDSLRYLVMADASLWRYPESEVAQRGKVVDFAQYMYANV